MERLGAGLRMVLSRLLEDHEDTGVPALNQEQEAFLKSRHGSQAARIHLGDDHALLAHKIEPSRPFRGQGLELETEPPHLLDLVARACREARPIRFRSSRVSWMSFPWKTQASWNPASPFMPPVVRPARTGRTCQADKGLCAAPRSDRPQRSWLMEILFGRTSGLLGTIRWNTPSRRSATTLLDSTSSGRVKVRLKVPKERSWE